VKWSMYAQYLRKSIKGFNLFVNGVSIIVPVFNEKGSLEELYRRITLTLKSLEYIRNHEIIFIDDCSTDSSLKTLKGISDRDNKCKVCRQLRRSGQGGAFKTGFDNASFDVCVTIDADLQVLPEDIPRIMEHIEKYDLVNARRIKRNDHFVTVFSSKVYNFMMKKILKSPLNDSASNYTAVKTRYVKGLSLRKNDHRYIIPIVMRRGATRFKEVDVNHFSRLKGKSKYSIFKAWTGFFEFFEFRRRLIRGLYN